MSLSSDLSRNPPHSRLRRKKTGQIQISLIQPHDLNHLNIPPQNVHHLPRSLPVGREVRPQVDRVRQPPPCHRSRHGRMDPSQLPSLITSRSNHRPRPRPTDHDRLALELRPPPQLDRCVESVHVEMGNRPLLEAHLLIVGGARDGSHSGGLSRARPGSRRSRRPLRPLPSVRAGRGEGRRPLRRFRRCTRRRGKGRRSCRFRSRRCSRRGCRRR